MPLMLSVRTRCQFTTMFAQALHGIQLAITATELYHTIRVLNIRDTYFIQLQVELNPERRTGEHFNHPCIYVICGDSKCVNNRHA